MAPTGGSFSSASEALEFYLNSQHLNSGHERKATPRVINKSSSWTHRKPQPLSVESYEMPHKINSLYQKDLQFNNESQPESFIYSKKFTPAEFRPPHNTPRCNTERSYNNERSYENHIHASQIPSENMNTNYSDNALNLSTTSTILSTLDKLKERLTKPSNHTTAALSSTNFGYFSSDTSSFVYSMTQPSLEQKVPVAKTCTPPNDYAYTELSTNGKMENLQSNYKNNCNVSPLDLIKMTEQPVGVNGLALRPKIPPCSPRDSSRRPSNKRSSSHSVSQKGNLRRSKSLYNTPSVSGKPVDEVSRTPRNVSWEANVESSRDSEVRRSNELFELLTSSAAPEVKTTSTTSKPIPSVRSANSLTTQSFPVKSAQTPSVISFECSTCVPKPLKRRPSSLERPSKSRNPSEVTVATRNDEWSRKPPKQSQDYNCSTTGFASQGITEKNEDFTFPNFEYKTSGNFDPWNSATSSQGCVPYLKKSDSDGSYIASKVVSQNAVQSESSLRSVGVIDRHFSKTVDNGVAASQQLPVFTKSHHPISSENAQKWVPDLKLPSGLSCGNESYVSAFDHVPLRCSTPRNVIVPSSRPYAESSRGKSALNDLESFRILSLSGGGEESSRSTNEHFKGNSNVQSSSSRIPPLSMLSTDGQQPIDSLKSLVRDMTEVTSITNRLANKSHDDDDGSFVSQGSGTGASSVAENSILTKSTIDALRLVEKGSDEFQNSIYTHLNSIRTINQPSTQ